MFSLRRLTLALLAAALAAPLTVAAAPPDPAAFRAIAAYRVPDWWRDAKLGIWAHWGPQSVPMEGDWYARGMYEPGNRQYAHHLATWGHPSVHGWKDVFPLWKAEHWDPDRLMALYKKAGARYFVSMGVHHDNFELWKSAHHRWNAVAMGPKRDIVGGWAAAARKAGLRFGVSEHLGASFSWWQGSHKADPAGPQAGVPYDGADPAHADLYHPPAAPGDTGWYSTNPAWHAEWLARVTDLIDHYDLDFLYTDGGVPFGNATGYAMIDHLYAHDAAKRHGPAEVVYTCKEPGAGRWIEDVERGVKRGISPEPWQTDTSIGDWFYNRNWKYRPAAWVIHLLADVVSKNGNLLLNVVQRPDGTLDPDAEQVVTDLASWTAVNGEAIFGTRPWLVYGEGRRAGGGAFKEDFTWTAADIRFTTKGPTLYAIALGWPADRRLVIRSLAGDAGTVEKVELLGYAKPLVFTRTAAGLVVTLPADAPVSPAPALRLTARGLVPAPTDETPVVRPDAAGGFTLGADLAELHGGGVQVEQRGGEPNLGYWNDPADRAAWTVEFPHAGTWTVTAVLATENDRSAFVVEVGDQHLNGALTRTGAWDAFTDVPLGTLTIRAPGRVSVLFRPADPVSWKALNLRRLRLIPTSKK